MLRIIPPLAMVLAASVWAQGPEDVGTVFRTDTRLVVVHTTVSDKEGRPVKGLPQQAFSVFEDGIKQEISSFRNEDIPVSIGLIIDNSASMRDKRARVEAAALALVKESNPEDEVFIVNFNDVAHVDNPRGKSFTSDIKEMEASLKRIDSRGGTAMRDAVRMAIDHVKSKGRKEKRVLVVVTDGADNESVVTLESLVRVAQRSDVLIYSVGLLGDEDPAEAAKARRALTEISAATGGASYFPQEVAEVDRIAHQVARDIRSQYTIMYVPSNAALDGKFREIKVTLEAPGDLTVRARKGYYASGGK